MVQDIFNFKSVFCIHLYKNTIYLLVWGTCIYNFPAWFINVTFDETLFLQKAELQLNPLQ